MASLDSPRTLILLILLVGVAYGGWVFFQNSQSQNPHWQIDQTRSGDFPPHRLNLWSDPNPPEPGETTFSVNLDFVNLMNDEIGSVRYELIDPENPTDVVRETATEYRETGPYRGRYAGAIDIPAAGEWILRIRSDWKDRSSTSEINITVK